MIVLLSLLWIPPIAAALLAAVVRPYKPFVGAASRACALVTFAAAVSIGAAVVSDTSGMTPRGSWRVDALSALLAVSIAFVFLLASAIGHEHEAGAARRACMFQNAVAAMMLLAVTVHNVALMWVAIEATTILSAVAIPLTRTTRSVEASWKYLLICSVGIALAFTGTVLAYFDFVTSVGHLPDALDWDVLRDAAPAMHPELMQLAFAFLLVGYGTKAGLAPMHTWMPDAYSEAPPPIAAMMSGALVAVAMYAIARWQSVADASIPPGFTAMLLAAFGVVSIAVGAFSLMAQRHYKRMLAYSSIEHMGLVSVGLALGPAGVFAALLHLVNHAVAKSMAFLLAGRILRRYQTGDLAGVSGLMTAMPWTGALFAAAVLALVGVPPFGLFVSEFLLVRAAVTGGRPWIAAIVLVLLLTAFISLVAHLNRMLYGPVPDGVEAGESRRWPIWSLAASAVVLVALGLALPSSVKTLIEKSVAVLAP